MRGDAMAGQQKLGRVLDLLNRLAEEELRPAKPEAQEVCQVCEKLGPRSRMVEARSFGAGCYKHKDCK